MKSRNLIIKSIKVDKNNRLLPKDGSALTRKTTDNNQSPCLPSSQQLNDGDFGDDDCSSVSSIDEDVNAMNIWDNSELLLRGVDIEQFSDYYGKKLSFLQLFKLRSTFYSKKRIPNSTEVFKGAEKIYKFCSSRITLEEYQEDDRMRNIVDINLAKDRNAIQFVRFFDNHIDSNRAKNRSAQYDRYASKSSHQHEDLASPSPLLRKKHHLTETPTIPLGLTPRKTASDLNSQRKSQLNLEQLNEIHRQQRNQMQQNHWTLREDASPEPKKSNQSFQFTEIEETEQSQITEDHRDREVASKFRTLNLSRVQSKEKINSNHASNNSNSNNINLAFVSKGLQESQTVGRQTISRNGSQLGIGQSNKSSPVKVIQPQQTYDKLKGQSTSPVKSMSEFPQENTGGGEFKLRLKVAHSEVSQDSNSPTTASPGSNYNKSNVMTSSNVTAAAVTTTTATTTTTTSLNEQLRQSLAGQIKRTAPSSTATTSTNNGVVKSESGNNPSSNFQKFLSTNTSPWKRGGGQQQQHQQQQQPQFTMTQSVNNNPAQKYSESSSPTRPVIRQGRVVQSSMVNSVPMPQDLKLPNIGRSKNSQSIISEQSASSAAAVTRSPMKQSKIFHQNSMGNAGTKEMLQTATNINNAAQGGSQQRSEVFTRSRKHNYSAFTGSTSNADDIFRDRVQIPSKQ